MTEESICPLAHRSDPERPRRASYGLVCTGHARGATDALDGFGALYHELSERLVGSGTGDGGHCARNDETGIDLDHHVVEARGLIRTQLVGWAKVVLEEGPWKYAPRDDVPDIARWLRIRFDWITCQDWCPDFVDEVTTSYRAGRSLIQPNNVYRIELGPCPEIVTSMDGTEVMQDRCHGTVIAVMRKATAREQLPSEVLCSEHGEHAWGPMEWHALGRRMGRSLHTSAAEAFMRAVSG